MTVTRWLGKNFNPRSPDGERPPRLRVVARRFDISIHAPRMGSDLAALVPPANGITFQSTLPGWGATMAIHLSTPHSGDFNPRSPDGERPYGTPGELIPKNFNPRSPDGERRDDTTHGCIGGRFQSTLPGWGATSH